MLFPDDNPMRCYLHRKLFQTQTRGHFDVQYLDEVDGQGFDPRRAILVQDISAQANTRFPNGRYTLFVLPEGIAVLRIEQYKRASWYDVGWAAYETRARAEERANWSRWATFARGRWTLDCPNVAGTYAAVARSCVTPADSPFTVLTDFRLRKLSKIEGIVRDVTDYCPATHRTLWRGWWWSEPLPMLHAPVDDAVSSSQEPSSV